MLKFSLRSLCALVLLASMSLAAFAQEINLVPFSDETSGLQGTVPEGWQSVNGVTTYRRQASDTDFTTLLIQSAPLSIDAIWPRLLPQFGLDATPESTGSYSGSAFDWTLYHLEVSQGDITAAIDLGLTEVNGTSHLVLLQTTPDESAALHDSVFLPVLDALSPLQAAEVPYQVEDLTFNDGDITLAGTLTVPDSEGQHPAVVLMTGSGPQDRDEIVVPGFPVFKLIADHLTRNGIAVLRYDDRGVGQSGGDYNSASIYDFVQDAEAAIQYLKTRPDIDPDQIGVLGHSEGGVDASIIGADPASGAAFIVSMAGPAVDGRSILLRQNEMIMQSAGASEAQIQQQLDYLNSIFGPITERDWDTAAELTRQHIIEQYNAMSDAQQQATGAPDAETYAQRQTDAFLQSYRTESFASFLDYDPAPNWAKTTIPVLALFGSLDQQVSAEQNAGPMDAALSAAGNADYSVVTIAGANHLFQAADTGAVSEYTSLPKEFTPEFLPTVTDWILAHVDVLS